jgi:hypothetical protein
MFINITTSNNHQSNKNHCKMAFIPTLTKSDILTTIAGSSNNPLLSANLEKASQCQLVTQAPRVVSSDFGRWHVTCSVQDVKGMIHTVACSGGMGGKDFSSICACSSRTNSLATCQHAFTVLLALVDKEEEGRRKKNEQLNKSIRRNKKKRTMEDVEVTPQAAVYIVLQALSEPERGYSYDDAKENYNPEILGVFFTLRQANQCAKEAIQELKGSNFHSDDDEASNSSCDTADEDDCSPIQWKSKEPPLDTSSGIPTVWVEHHDVQDASKRFRR